MPYYKSDNNISFFYQINGNGYPLIFTHGASWDHKQWNEQVNYFKGNYSVITWDVRGHGKSSLSQDTINPEDFKSDLIKLMDYLNIENAILCGLSMGGHISLQTAISFPERVKSLILIGTPCSNKFNLYEKICVLINRFTTKLIPMKLFAKLIASSLSKYNQSNYNYIYETVTNISHSDWNKVWNAVTRMESKNKLHKVKCPTLLLLGEYDNLTNKHQSYMNNHIANSELVIIPNAHHGTNLDNPVDVNISIEKFLNK